MGSDPPAAPLVRPTFEDLGKMAWSYLPRVLPLLGVRRADVEDMVNDIVIDAWEMLVRRGGTLDPVAPGAPPEAAIKAWISTVAWWRTRDYCRSGCRRREVFRRDDDREPESSDIAPSSEQIIALGQRSDIVRRILSEMNPGRAKVLFMFDALGMTAPDIAEAVGIKLNTVKSRVARARADFIAAKRRLHPDEQRAIEHCPLVVPFGLWDDQPAPNGDGGAMFTAVAAAAALVIGISAGWSARARTEARQETPIVAAPEATPAEAPTTTPSAAPPAMMSAPIPEPAKPPSVRRAATRAAAPSEAELAYMRAARKALRAGHYRRALDHLAAHEHEFAQGQLAQGREWLRAEVRAAMVRDRANPPAE